MRETTSRGNSITSSPSLKRKLILTVICLASFFVFVQFVKLTTVGRIGRQISEVKAQQDELELQNELLKTEINKLKTPTNLEETLAEKGSYYPAQIQTISLYLEEDILALNN